MVSKSSGIDFKVQTKVYHEEKKKTKTTTGKKILQNLIETPLNLVSFHF